MVAFFRYSTIDILSVTLPPSVLEFNSHVQQEWISKEASEVVLRIQNVIYMILESCLCLLKYFIGFQSDHWQNGKLVCRDFRYC